VAISSERDIVHPDPIGCTLHFGLISAAFVSGINEVVARIDAALQTTDHLRPVLAHLTESVYQLRVGVIVDLDRPRLAIAGEEQSRTTTKHFHIALHALARNARE
jgi:hypothetical protein